MPIPDSLAEKIELFRRRGRIVKHREGVFLDASWIAVYTGQGIVPDGYDARADLVDPAALTGAMHALRDEIAASVGRAPHHAEFLDRHCAMAEPA